MATANSTAPGIKMPLQSVVHLPVPAAPSDTSPAPGNNQTIYVHFDEKRQINFLPMLLGWSEHFHKRKLLSYTYIKYCHHIVKMAAGGNWQSAVVQTYHDIKILRTAVTTFLSTPLIFKLFSTYTSMYLCQYQPI